MPRHHGAHHHAHLCQILQSERCIIATHVPCDEFEWLSHWIESIIRMLRDSYPLMVSLETGISISSDSYQQYGAISTLWFWISKKNNQKNVRQCARELRCAIRMLQDNFDIWPLVVLKERALVVWRWKKNRRQGYTVHVTIDLRLSRGLPSHGSLVDKNGQSDLEGAFYRLHTWGHRHKVRTQRSVVAKGIEQRPQKGKLC